MGTAAHLAGIEQAERVHFALEAQLVGIDALIAAAVFERDDVRVGDHDAASFVAGHDLVEAFGRAVTHDRNAACGHKTVDADEFEMLPNLVAELGADLGHSVNQTIMRIEALQISDAAVRLEHLQRRVVPGVLVERRLAEHVFARRFVGDLAARLCEQRLEAFDRHIDDHGVQDALAVGNIRTKRRKMLRHRPLHRRQQLFHDAVGHGDGMTEANGLDEIIESDDDVDPGLGRRQWHLENGDDTGRAVGAADLLRRVAAQVDDARLFLKRHDARGDDVAGLAHAAERHAADAAGAARHEAADMRTALGRGVHAQFETFRPGRGVDIKQLGASLDADKPRLLPFDPVETRHIEHDAAFERNALAVIAGGPATHRQRQAMPEAGPRNANDFVLVPRPHHNVGNLILQHLLQDRAVPEVITRIALQIDRVGGGLDAGNIAEKTFEPAAVDLGRLCGRGRSQHQTSLSITLSCHEPSAMREMPITTRNKAMPASVIRNRAANMRGISSW